MGSSDLRSTYPTDRLKYSSYSYDNKYDNMHATTCILSFRRNLLLKIFGFNINFKLAWREDSEICFRIRAIGFPLVYRPTAWMTHLRANIRGIRGSNGIGSLAQQN